MAEEKLKDSEIKRLVENVKNEKHLIERVDFYISKDNSIKTLLENKQSGVPDAIPDNLYLEWVNLFYADGEVNEEKLNEIERKIEEYISKNNLIKPILSINQKDKSKNIYKIGKSWLTDLIFSEDLIYEMLLSNDVYKFKGQKFLKNFRCITRAKLFKIKGEFKLDNFEFSLLIIKINEIESTQKRIKKSKIRFTNKLSLNFSKENNYENEILDTIKGEYAKGKIITTILYEGDKIESEFTDFQAFHICKGLKNHETLYDKYIENKVDDYNRAQAHIMAMNLLKDKGRDIVNLLLSLPSLPFNCKNFKVLFSSLDKAKEQNNDHPKIRLKIKNAKNQEDEIEYEFFSKDGEEYINQIRVRNKTKNTDLFHISREGKVITEENINPKKLNKNTVPVLELFYRITENKEKLKEAILSYGLETGKCSVCGKTLKRKESILRGIGPVCETYLQ